MGITLELVRNVDSHTYLDLWNQNLQYNNIAGDLNANYSFSSIGLVSSHQMLYLLKKIPNSLSSSIILSPSHHQ
jgi:uncharacterized alpha/beta hydrolase family protein